MKKIAILGGTFDPITNAHLEIARKIRDTYDLDVLFLIAKTPRWKSDISSEEDRLNMLKLALKGEDRFSIDLTEINSNYETNFTIDTILNLSDKYKDYELYYIIGSDQLNKLDKWKNINELSALVKFIVIERNNYPINEENLILYDCIDSKIKLDDISSTNIRNYKSVDTKKCVLDYIYEKGIYAKNLLKGLIDEERYEHSLRVAELAKKLAKSNEIDENKAYYAGLIHDCAKRLPHDKMIELMLKYEKDNIDKGFNVYHQYLAPLVAKEKFNCNDEEILHAIKYHTTGEKNMNKLDKIIFLADKLEEGRGYDSSKEIELAMLNCDYAYAYVFNNNIEYLLNVKKINVDSEQMDEYNKNKAFMNEFKINKIFDLLSEKLAFNLVLYDCTTINTIYSYAIVCEAMSERQLVALSDEVEDLAIRYGFSFHHKECQNNSGWALIDLADTIVHIFTNNNRNDYGIDENLKDAKIVKKGE